MKIRYRIFAWAVPVLLALVANAASAQERKAYTIANYPVQAVAGDAVAAKSLAIKEGQRAAYRALLKRIVPVSLYSRLEAAKNADASTLIDGYAVRSEQNSSTEYIASLDFTFSMEAVRSLLRRDGIAFIDESATAVTLVPVFRPGPGKAPVAGLGEWGEIWGSLDLEHTITPLRLSSLKPTIHADTLGALQDGDISMVRTAVADYGTRAVLFAFAEPDTASRRLNITLIGRDASGPISLKSRYPLADGDLAYAMEYAAVISLGIIEGRWKAVRARSKGGLAALSGPAEQFAMHVEFASPGQWYQIQDRLRAVDGVGGFRVGSVSARGADVSLSYPGGARQLAGVLSGQGFALFDSGGTWVLRAGR